MYTVQIRFYEELNDFIKPELRKKDIPFSFAGKRSVKDLVESFGVPHLEIDLIIVNGESVSFEYIVKDLDRISVYPVFEALDVTPLLHLREKVLRDTKFICDVHLGALSRKLRMLGFDTYYEKFANEDEVAAVSLIEKRILLTRNSHLLMRKSVTHGLFVHATDSLSQVKEIVDRLDLYSSIRYFSRCGECNGVLVKKSAHDLGERIAEVPEMVKIWNKEYSVCGACGHIYWLGSHCDNFREDIERLFIEKDKSIKN